MQPLVEGIQSLMTFSFASWWILMGLYVFLDEIDGVIAHLRK